MGTAVSKTDSVSPNASPAADKESGACPLGFDKLGKDSSAKSAAQAPHPVPGGSSAKCPVRHGKAPARGKGDEASAGAEPEAADAAEGESKSPVEKKRATKYLNPHAYDVYGRPKGKKYVPTLNPLNHMPVDPNNGPSPGQKQELSTDRVQSNIPKGGEESTWTYPSPQMFWNALSRKGKIQDTEEADMDMVVAIHNNMNENTWKQILKWEELRWDDPQTVMEEPRLLRFTGRPDETSPKAIARLLTGHPLPFDRHDWIVDRGGKERRYIIDYYHDDHVGADDTKPDLHEEGAIKSIKTDVRPALDGIHSVLDRVFVMPFARLTGGTDFKPLPFVASATMRNSQRPANPPMLREVPGVKLNPEQQRLRREQIMEDMPELRPKIEKKQKRIQQKEALTKALARRKGLDPNAGFSLRNELPKWHVDFEAAEKTKKKFVDPHNEEELREVLDRIKTRCARRLQMLQEATAGLDPEAAETTPEAMAAAVRLDQCTARVVCRPQARAYQKAVDQLTATAATDTVGMASAERELDARIYEMRECLNSFTERQVIARRKWMAQVPEKVQEEEPSPLTEEQALT